MLFNYEEFASRNFPLLSKEEQERLRTLRVGIAGCGMGSQVAVNLARLGIVNFVIADGDTVEVSNLNRQAYFIHQIGRNKAEALKEILVGINNSNVVSIPEFLNPEDANPEDADSFVGTVDLLIDCIDPSFSGLKVSFALNEASRAQGKLDFYPMPCGWGGRLYVFSPRGVKLKDFLGMDDEIEETNKGFPIESLQGAFALPTYMIPIFGDLVKGELGHYPQLVCSTAITTSLVVMAVVKMIRGEDLRVAPDYYVLDPFEG